MKPGNHELFYVGRGREAHDCAMRMFGTAHTDMVGNVFAWRGYPDIRFGWVRRELARLTLGGAP